MRIMCRHKESAEVCPLDPRRPQSIASSLPGCGAFMLLRRLKIYRFAVRLEAPGRQASVPHCARCFAQLSSSTRPAIERGRWAAADQLQIEAPFAQFCARRVVGAGNDAGAGCQY